MDRHAHSRRGSYHDAPERTRHPGGGTKGTAFSLPHQSCYLNFLHPVLYPLYLPAGVYAGTANLTLTVTQADTPL